jgi:hypothetical protein
MLTADQIASFFLHEDPLIREHAIRSLERAGDQGPADADLLWRVMDRYPPSATSDRHAFRLHSFRQTDASLQRTYDALAAAPDDNLRYHLHNVLRGLPGEQLAMHRAAILGEPTLDDALREHLRLRLDAPEQAPEELWNDLLKFCRDNDENDWGKLDHDAVERIIERLAAHREFAGREAMKILRDPEILDYRECFACEILGKIRWAPAIPLLVPRLYCDGDISCERSMEALGAIATPEVVAQIAAHYHKLEIDFHGYMHEALGRIRLPESESLLIELLREDNEEENTSIAMEVCDLCSQDALPLIEEMIEHEAFDSTIEDMERLAVVVAAMTGYPLRRAEHWRQRVDERERMFAAREKELENGGIFDTLEELLRVSGHQEFVDDPGDWDSPAAFPDDYIGRYEAPQPVEPIRAEEKIGRNEPCPCGSGKKYKKCCGK